MQRIRCTARDTTKTLHPYGDETLMFALSVMFEHMRNEMTEQLGRFTTSKVN